MTITSILTEAGEEVVNKSVSQTLQEWKDFIYKHNSEIVLKVREDEEDIPEDIRDNVIKIRQILADNNIDPSSLVLIDNDFKQDDKEFKTTMTLTYDHYVKPE